MARQNCSLAWLFTKFSLSRRNLFGPRRRLTGGVPASLDQRTEHRELVEASGLLILQVTLLYLLCTSHFLVPRKLNLVVSMFE